MLIIQATAVDSGGEPSTETTARTVEDVLWAHATSDHGLEHVRARAGPHGIGVVLFLRADRPAGALAKADSLLTLAFASPALARYTVALMPP